VHVVDAMTSRVSTPSHHQRGRASAVIASDLDLRGIGKSFDRTPVLTDISLRIAPGEVVCLLGPSGCGKSTLLRIIAGIEELSSGSLLMDGQIVSDSRTSLPPERRGIGMVFQDYALFPQMTVLQNVAFGLRRLASRDRQPAAEQALGSVGLLAKANDYPSMLSGGEQQRVALARALAPRPRVLLMDEPFSNLDARMRDAVREDTVRLLRETRATCILVTHDPEEAMRVADRIMLLRQGRIVQVGKPEALYNAPIDLEAARFFCDLNEIPCQIVAGVAETPVGRFEAAGRPDGAGLICVRPPGFIVGEAGQGTRARIRSSRYLGVVHHVELVLEGLDAPVRARMRHAHALKAGQDIGITINPDEVLVFGGRPA
jgi:iron(III) transport system ATP-binding protein